MSGTICFILCALNVGLRVLRIRLQSSPSARLSILHLSNAYEAIHNLQVSERKEQLSELCQTVS